MSLAAYQPLLWLLALLGLALGAIFTLVDRPRWKLLASVGCRGMAIALLAMALCGPTVPGSSSRLHVAFLVDVSNSVSLDQSLAALDRVESGIVSLGATDSWSLSLVGASLMRFDQVDAARTLLEQWKQTGGDEDFRAQSDLVRAIELTQFGLPADRAARIVLFTDGKATGRAMESVLGALRDEGVDVVVGHLDGLDKPEAGVIGVAASPDHAYEGELVRLHAQVISNHDGSADVHVVHQGVIVARRSVELAAGLTQDVDFTVPMVTPGRSLWQVEIVPDDDYFAINNQASCVVEVGGRPRVLILHRQPREMREFERAMEQQGLIVESRPPVGVPATLDELLSFDAVVLADVPATDLDATSLERLRRYVGDFGGGLAMFGSENSFGLGGYFRTPVEEVLPLTSRYEKEREQPSMAMVLVIDKSGSMTGLPIALARQAAKAAVELLGPRDQIGIVAFDERAVVASEMMYGSSRSAVEAAIDRVDAGGGTFMYAGMNAAKELLSGTVAQIKHVIVLSDGMTQPADHDGVVRELLDQGVTVSTVALSDAADRALMAHLAEIGRGRYYETNDPANVPQIFTRETVQASRSAIKEDLFASIKVANHPMLDGIGENSLPFSLGFVMTRAKPTARVLLVTETGEPLLAVNNYGLGGALAFTSDLTPKWGAEWLAWPTFGKFWAQALRSIIRRPDADVARVESEVDGDSLLVRAFDPPDADATNRGTWQVESIDALGRSESIDVHEVGLGRSVARVPLSGLDQATVRVHNAATGWLRVIHYERAYPAEYNLAADPDPAIATLHAFESGAIRSDVQTRRTSRRLAPWLLVLACVCFIAGLALRRV